MGKIFLLTICLWATFVELNAQTPGNALRYEGYDDEVRLPLPSYIGKVGTKSFTVEMWVKDEISDTYWGDRQYLFAAQTDIDTYIELMLDKGQLSAHYQDGAEVGNTYAEIPDIRLKWAHIALVFYSETKALKIFLNGEDITMKGTYSNKFSVTKYIGYTNTMVIGGSFYLGIIDEVRIWNYALSSCQIKAGMNSDYTLPVPTGLMTYFNFNQGAYGGNNSDVTILKDLKQTNHATLYNFDLGAGNYSSNWVVSNSPITKNNVDIDDYTNAVTQNGGTLTTVLLGATYQWMTYSTQWTNINGATAQSFAPTSNGKYAVKISKNGCTQLSSTINFVATSVNVKGNSNVNVYSDPNGGLTIDNISGEVSVEIYNLSGVKVDEYTISNQSTHHFQINQSAGIYFIKIKSGNTTLSTHKIIKR